MSKLGLCLTSLVGAIPGAGLAYVMVMAFVNYAGGWSVTVKGLAGTLLLIGGILAVMPLGILLFAGPKAEKKIKKSKTEEPAKEAEGSGEAQAADAAQSGELVPDDAETFEVDEESPDSEAFTETIDQPVVNAGSDEFDRGDEIDFDTDPDGESKRKK
ncbi:MAG: hypothetical protein EXS05_03525 [Planctomycetaceae bacterium]|nr:hypothetical protein [Planctomycetaceae bacterium]